jgi:hypothetical protein
MAIFKPKISICADFGNLLAKRYVLMPVRILYGHKIYFVVILVHFSSFSMVCEEKSGNSVPTTSWARALHAHVLSSYRNNGKNNQSYKTWLVPFFRPRPYFLDRKQLFLLTYLVLFVFTGNICAPEIEIRLHTS